MIDFQAKTVYSRSKEVYDLQESYVKSDHQLNIVLSHFGYFSQDLVNGFTENVEEILISSGEKKQLIKRIFSILIEGLQNIRVHCAADDEGNYYGSFILAKNESKYIILFGSLVKSENKDLLEQRIQNLNDIDEDLVKDHYMSILTNGIVSITGNAGLGFITMRLKSKAKIKANFYPVSDKIFYFTTEIVLQREA